MNLFNHGLKLFSTKQFSTTVLRPFFLKNYLTHTKTPPLIKIKPNGIIPIRQLKTTRNPRTPDLIYVPHVLRWLKTKFRLKYLQKSWDPEFSEGAFIYGTTQAVCRITEIIHADKPELLEGLLTDMAKMKLEKDMAKKITKAQKQIIKLKPADIKILVPTAVHLKSQGTLKQCNVALRSLALKWYENGSSLKLVLVALQTEFVRDYTHGANSEWTINIFDILECAMLSDSRAAR